MTDREFRTLRGLTTELRGLREQVHALQEKLAAESSTTNPSQPTQVEIVSAPDPATTEYYRAENQGRRSFWQKWCKPAIEVIGSLGTAVVALLALQTLWQVQDQTAAVIKSAEAAEAQVELSRRQMVGTYAAAIEFANPQLRPEGKESRPSTIMLVIANRGHVAAKASAHVSVIRRSRGEDEEIASDDIPKTQISMELAFTKHYPLLGFTPTELDSLKIDTPEQVLIVKGTLNWDNGFGDEYSSDFCYSLFANRPYTLNGTTASGGYSFIECINWPGARNNIVRAQQQASGNQ